LLVKEGQLKMLAEELKSNNVAHDSDSKTPKKVTVM
jgi:hypothetical protein